MSKKLAPKIDLERCVVICPAKALKLVRRKAALVDADACTSEGKCIAVCPTKAIWQLEPQEY
jgi:ferredoxin